MRLVKTKSFKLAVNTKGKRNAKKMAIILPGRMDTKDYECFNLLLELLARKGYFAICFDPPGTWESPGETSLFTTTNYIKAVNELIEYFDGKQVFLAGHSRGGQVAILVGTTNPKVFAFASINGSLGTPSAPDKSEVKNCFIDEYRDLPPGTHKTRKQKKFALSVNYFKDGRKYNAVKSLETCTKPKLFIYGRDDEFTSPGEVKEMFKKTPKPKVLHWLDTHHDYRYDPSMVKKVNQIVERFLDTYC